MVTRKEIWFSMADTKHACMDQEILVSMVNQNRCVNNERPMKTPVKTHVFNIF